MHWVPRGLCTVTDLQTHSTLEHWNHRTNHRRVRTKKNNNFHHLHEKTETWPERHRINRVMMGEVGVCSLEQQVLIRLLRQHVGRLCDGTQLSQAGGDLLFCPFPELLLLLLDLLQPVRGGHVFIVLTKQQRLGSDGVNDSEWSAGNNQPWDGCSWTRNLEKSCLRGCLQVLKIDHKSLNSQFMIQIFKATAEPNTVFLLDYLDITVTGSMQINQTQSKSNIPTWNLPLY